MNDKPNWRFRGPLIPGESQADRTMRLTKARRKIYNRLEHPNAKPLRPKFAPVTKEFILSNIAKDEVTGCWNWNKTKSKGYGRASHLGKQVQLQRIAYELWNETKIPAEMFACHKCDNRACCNPDHIFLGSQVDNMRDKEAKGRGITPNKKLTNQQADDIRRDGRMQKVIAAEYGVSQQCVSRIQLGRLYI